MAGLFALFYGLLYGTAKIGNGIKHTIYNEEEKQEAIKKGRDHYLDYKGRMIDIETGHHYTRMYKNNDLCICDADDHFKIVRNLDKEKRDKAQSEAKKYAKEEGQKRYYRLDSKKTEWIRHNRESKYVYWHIPTYYGMEWNLYGDLNDSNRIYYRRVIFNSYYMIDIDTGLIQKEQENNVKVYDKPVKGHEVEWITIHDNHANIWHQEKFNNINDLMKKLNEIAPKYQREFGKPFYL